MGDTSVSTINLQGTAEEYLYQAPERYFYSETDLLKSQPHSLGQGDTC